MGLLRRICMVALRVTLPQLSGCEQMVKKPTHIDRGRLDLVLTDVPDVVGVLVGSPVEISDQT